MNNTRKQTNSATVDTLLERLDGVRQVGDGRWMARCPGHDDRGPSLSIRDTGERTLIHCFSSCEASDILAAVGLTWQDIIRDKWQAAEHAATHQKIKLPPIDPLKLEWRIIQIARADKAAGKQISIEDKARLQIALERVRVDSHG